MTLNLVVQPLQILVGIALLIYTLGYSALVGLAVSSNFLYPLFGFCVQDQLAE